MLLLDQSQFDREMDYEYKLALRKYYSLLSEDEQSKILKWIKNCPPFLQTYLASIEEPRYEEATIYLKQWTLNRLYLIEENLSSADRISYDALLAEIGQVREPKPYSNSVHDLDNSPIKCDELAKLQCDEIISNLIEWKASDQWGEPSIEGLSYTFRNVVKQRFHEFVSIPQVVQDLHIEYQSAYLGGLADYISGGQVVGNAINWFEHIQLCQRLLEFQPESSTTIAVEKLMDRTWLNICDTVINFLRNGMNIRSGYGFSINLQESIWNIILQLATDPAIFPDFSTEIFQFESDTLNSSSAKVLNSVVDYICWIHSQNIWQGTQRNFNLDYLSDAKQILELNLKNPSKSVRGVYGMRFTTLYSLDTTWVSTKLDQVFPFDILDRDIFYTVWYNFIQFNHPSYTYELDLLNQQYRKAIDYLSIDRDSQDISYRSYGEGLSERLYQFFKAEYLDLSGYEQLLQYFFENATSQNTEYFMRRLGFDVMDEDEFSEGFIEAIKSLWNIRIPQLLYLDDQRTYQELLRFTNVFISQKFDVDWSLPLYKLILKKIKSFDFLFVENFFERLFELISNSHEQDVVEILVLLSENEVLPYGIFRQHTESLEQLLVLCLNSSESSTKQATVEFINRLIPKGIDHRELLQEAVT